MHHVSRAAALAVAALAASQVASAGFVYQSATRGVTASVGGSVVSSDATAALGPWYGSASSSTSSYSILSTQGSSLTNGEMTFVGAAQINASNQAALGATSTATVNFVSDLTESIRWIASLGRDTSGNGNSAAISLSIVDLVTNVTVLAFTGPTIASGSFDVQAGRAYRLTLSASSVAAGPTHSLANYNVGFFSTVPGPGALALLGVSGLFARRSRR